MKRTIIFFIGGAIAATAGFLIGLPFSNRLIRWVIVGVCISIFCHGYNTRDKKLVFTPFIGGGAVVLGWFLGKYITYTMVVWPLFGLIVGATVLNQMTITERIKKAFFGFIGGFIGVHFFPFIYFGVLPLLSFPFMAWDIDKMGLILSGGTIALGVALGGRKND